MPFKIVNDLITFQKYINLVLYNYWNIFCIIYLKNVKSYIKNIKKVLKYLFKGKLFIKLEKCIFSILEIIFLNLIFIIENIKINLN